MKKGIKFWNISTIRYDQTRNSIEAIIKKVLAENKLPLKFLESCGASATACILEGMGFVKAFDYPQIGGVRIQFDDFITVALNDPKNDRIFSKGNVFDNRIMRNYLVLARMLFPHCKPEYNAFTWDELTTEIYNGNGALICLKKPGHYIAGIAYDNVKNVILFSDSWGTRKGLKHGGWHEELTEKEFNNNVMAKQIVFREV